MVNFIKGFLNWTILIIMSILLIIVEIIVCLINCVKDLFGGIYVKYLSVKKYNENMVRKKLGTQLYKLLLEDKKIYICDEYWIKSEEYSSYVTLKYIFTGDKKIFKYNKKYDKYLYNFFDFNAYKEGFTQKWINEIKNIKDERISVKEVVIKDYFDETKEKKVLEVSYK